VKKLQEENMSLKKRVAELEAEKNNSSAFANSLTPNVTVVSRVNVYYMGVLQRGVLQGYVTGVCYRGMLQGCVTGVCYSGMLQRGMLQRGVLQWYVTEGYVTEGCVTGVCYRGMLQWYVTEGCVTEAGGGEGMLYEVCYRSN